jgi:hypothetical protein
VRRPVESWLLCLLLLALAALACSDQHSLSAATLAPAIVTVELSTARASSFPSASATPAHVTPRPPAPTPRATTDAPAQGYAGYVSGISPHARQIFQQGQRLGNRPNVFSKVGDSITASPLFLSPIGVDQYNLRSYTELQGVIDFYTASNARGNDNSFYNTSLAAKVSWRAQSVLSPDQADSIFCNAGETPLACEYRLVRPSVALIMLGTNDVPLTADVTFEFYMRQVVQVSLDSGVIPVLSTIPPLFRPGLEGRAEQLNAIIVRLAREYDIPLWDYWSALQGLPNSGMASDGVHPDWAPAGHNADFAAEYMQYGTVVRNLTALYALDAIWKQVIQP